MKLATLCYIRHRDRTLMVHRVKKENDIHAGKWNGLGGKFEPGESPEDCARREILEESGLVARSLRLKGLLTFPEFAQGEDWYAFVFVVDEYEGELIDSPEGNLAWVRNTEIFDLNLWDRWILSRLNRTISDVEKYLSKYNFSFASRLLNDFFWNEYCDWYVESAKVRVYSKGSDDDKRSVLFVLWYILEKVKK